MNFYPFCLYKEGAKAPPEFILQGRKTPSHTDTDVRMHPYIILLLLLETSVFQVPLINSSGKGSIWIEAKQFKYPSLTPHTNYVTTFHGCVVLGFTHSPVLNWQHFFCLSVMQKSQARIFTCLTFEIPGPDLSEVQSLCKCV